ncbi:P-loop containing nucleoside triphosphate hydrolase protein [Schizopora paradoxa]|uniref:DNA 3'-5' helicase n=1 Tax=Schizopora paradoxa TaxID=27342 RepID=A0A0H2R646_9AGAM|nr:P-loop containing nucleoside triphosphate hydrolase protein [Schizopora paradoxa]
MNSKQNMVVSAPTGGGKTVLFELGIIQTLIESGHKPSSKCVYVAPTKALCSERFRDWNTKLEPLGVKCIEMTGDTVQLGKSAWSEAKNATIIVTTGEKWDSLTRSWHEHDGFLSEIKLFLVDEVHILNESRGSTLEVVISRMKARAEKVRFIMVSATVPNIHDIANWIGNPTIGPSASAIVFEFGDEYRPCKLTRHVHGFPRKQQNDFQFMRTLDFKLYDILLQHHTAKPMLVFCPTRKGVVATAEQLLKNYDESVAIRKKTPWVPGKIINRSFHDARLEKLANAGIGVHHAGLNMEDRRATEALFLDGALRVVVATSTLAVGVNLPAHTVVIKGVKLYQANAWQEYSDLDIVQMIGRAGRPQFDKEGVAIIMCESELEGKYRNMIQGKTVLESSLHHNLVEHINSEIGMRSITNLVSAKEWIRNSFLRQRIQKNPGHYQIGKAANQTWEEKLDEMASQSIATLKETQLINDDEGNGVDGLAPTDYGVIMSKYYIRQSTMGMIMKMPERASVREILEIISSADELGDVKLRGGDKQAYSKLKDHNDIRYKIKKVEKASDKTFLLIQAVLGGISLSSNDFKPTDSQPALEALSVFRHTSRIARVVVEVAITNKNGAQLKHGMELLRCLTAKAWEDRPVVLKQVDSIGEKSLKVLAEAGITTLQALKSQEPIRIEVLLNRRPPFGHEILAFVNDLPQYDVSIVENGVRTFGGKRPVEVDLDITCSILATSNAKGSRNTKQKSRSSGMASILTLTSDLDFIDFRRTTNKYLKDTKAFNVTVELHKPSVAINVLISSVSAF